MSRSVLQDWVMELPLREQGTLLTVVRGCDVAPKYPLDSTERQLTGFLRWCFLTSADPREVGIVGAFFQDQPPEPFKPSALGHYPLHWVMHVVHALEVVAYRHPSMNVRNQADDLYLALVQSFHLAPESWQQMVKRLSEDRIASGTVVS